jgi:hypothetical protein
MKNHPAKPARFPWRAGLVFTLSLTIASLIVYRATRGSFTSTEKPAVQAARIVSTSPARQLLSYPHDPAEDSLASAAPLPDPLKTLSDAAQRGQHDPQLLATLAIEAWKKDRLSLVDWLGTAHGLSPELVNQIADALFTQLDPGGDTTGLAEIVAQLPVDAEGRRLSIAFTALLATSDPQGALGFARLALNEQEKIELGREIGLRLSSGPDLDRAIELIAGETDPALQSALAEQFVASRLTPENPPEALLAWVEENRLRAPERFRAAWLQTVKAAAGSSPAETRRRIAELKDPDLRRDALEISAGALGAGDPSGTADWLARSGEGYAHAMIPTALDPWLERDAWAVADWATRLPAGRPRDIALGEVVRQLSIVDPQHATPWLALIEDEEIRQSAAAHAALGLASIPTS